MSLLRLSNMTMNRRLTTIAGMIQNSRGLIDVGTDHGYLPVFLAQNGYTGRLLASDIKPLPLQSAICAAQDASLEDRIGFLLCDGLDGCPRDEIDTIVIAGMGGDLICRILDRAEWCLDARYTLILQPMTRAEVLRYWLVNNGFVLSEERLVRDGFLYQIIKAEYREKNMQMTDAELFSGAWDNIKDDPLTGEMLDMLLQRFEKEQSGLLSSGRREEARLALCRGIMDGLREMKGKLR